MLGNIFLRAGGVTTRGMRDLFSVMGELTFGDLEESRVFLCSPGENLGMRLFLSPAVYDEDITGAGDLARGEGARLLPTGGVLG